MTSLAEAPIHRPLTRRLEFLALPVLLGVAVYLWTAPLRTEQALQHASLSELESAARRDPDNAHIYYYQGNRLRQSGKDADARTAYKKAVERDGEYEPAWLAWAETANALGEKKEALSVLTTFEKAHPACLRAPLMQARICQQGFWHTQAYAAAEAAARIAPQNAEAWRLQGEAAMALTRWKDGVAAFDKANSLAAGSGKNPTSAPGTLWQAQTELRDAGEKMEQRRYLEAEQVFHTLLESNPNSATATQGVGLALYHQGKTAQALGALMEALRLDPGLPETHFRLAGVNYAAGLLDEATRRLQIAVRLNPESGVYWDALGTALRAQMDKYVEAEEATRHAVTLEPDNVVFLADLADILGRAHKNAEAEATYRRALALAPGKPDVQFGLARLLVETRPIPPMLAEAETLLKQVLATDPNHAGALYDLGRIALKRGATEQAVTYLEDAVVHAPRNPYPFFQLFLAYQKLGNRQRALACKAAFDERRTLDTEINDLEQAARQRPKEPEVRLRLARTLDKAQEPAKALNQYQVYLNQKPQDKAVHQEYERLTARLQAEGKLPPMALFNALIDASVKWHTPVGQNNISQQK